MEVFEARQLLSAMHFLPPTSIPQHVPRRAVSGWIPSIVEPRENEAMNTNVWSLPKKTRKLKPETNVPQKIFHPAPSERIATFALDIPSPKPPVRSVTETTEIARIPLSFRRMSALLETSSVGRKRVSMD
jgi:hypothetical protein